MSVRDTWSNIESWLSEHAHFVLESLNPGTTVEAIRATETRLGVGVFPDDFAQSWQIHDGQIWDRRVPLIAGWLGSYCLIPLHWIEVHWESWTGLASSGAFDGVCGTPRGPVRADWWNRRWIPIGVNGVGDLVCLDLDPPEGGTVGQVIEVLHEEGDRTVLAPNFGAWLDGYASDLEIDAYGVYDSTHGRYYGLVHARDHD